MVGYAFKKFIALLGDNSRGEVGKKTMVYLSLPALQLRGCSRGFAWLGGEYAIDVAVDNFGNRVLLGFGGFEAAPFAHRSFSVLGPLLCVGLPFKGGAGSRKTL